MLPATLLLLLAALPLAPQKLTFVVPSFPDMTIKTRDTRGVMTPMLTTYYFKGARERVQHVPEGPPDRIPFEATIMQCDQSTTVRLFARTKTYDSFVSHVEISQGERRRRVVPPPQPTGPVVVVTIDSVDTGERRQYGSYEAHRIRTRITIEPTAGATAKPGRVDVDGWYLDVAGASCRENPHPENISPGEWIPLVHPGPNHLVFKHLGTAPHGLTLEETAKQQSDGNVLVNKTELVEISYEPLDQSLFEVPADYVLRERPMPRLPATQQNGGATP